MRERLPSGLTLLDELHVPKMGSKNNEMREVLDELYGPARWSYYWLKGDEAVDISVVYDDYERSYGEFFDVNPEAWEEVLTYGDVYDTSPANTEAGLDYSHKDERGAVHIQDTAIRNLVVKRGKSFTPGAPLLQIRTTSESEVGRMLSPFYVPFHTPELILPYEGAVRSWHSGSVEEFYQSNRRLAVADAKNLGSIATLRAFMETNLT